MDPFQMHNHLGNCEVAIGFFRSAAYEQGMLSAMAHGSFFFLGKSGSDIQDQVGGVVLVGQAGFGMFGE